MKNVVKKLFSLLLVGVVAISMFSFVAPPAEAAEAAEAGSNGTLIINQSGIYKAGFHVTFYDSVGGNLDEYDTGYLAVGKTRDFKIPKYTYRVHVYVAIQAGKKRHFDFYADESIVNENSRIELTSTRTTQHPKFDVKFNNGWSEKKSEYPHEESIQFTSYFNADNPNMYFKATFYREDCQIGERSVKLSNIGDYPRGTVVDSETIKIPYATTSIKVEVIKEGTPINSDTLKYNPANAKKSKDDITITLGNWDGRWDSMKINCPNSWKDPEPAKRGTIQLNNNFIADHPSIYFKATFYRGAFGYRYNQKIGETNVKLLTLDELFWQNKDFPYSKTIGIPDGTTSVEVKVIKNGEQLDSATLEYIPKSDSKDDITITLGDKYRRWDLMKINCPESWQRIEK